MVMNLLVPKGGIFFEKLSDNSFSNNILHHGVSKDII
jgi:hypothetical protein